MTDLLGPRVLEDGDLRIEPLTEIHREALRAACAADLEIWQIYSYSMAPDAFDGWWDGMRTAPNRAFQAILAGGALVGTSSYTILDRPSGVVEIGGTYFRPEVRGTGVNTRAKRLMVGAVFAAGARRLEFRVDAINTRSRHAVEKLGATLDGILRQNRVTWTGRARDSCVYSILAEEMSALPLFPVIPANAGTHEHGS